MRAYVPLMFLLSFCLAGTALAAPHITVTRGITTSMVDNVGVTDLGSANVGDVGAPMTFVVGNNGDATLSGIAVQIVNGDVVVNTSYVSATLSPGISASFTVSLAPAALGVRTALVQVVSNDPGDSPFRINLTGTGVNIPGGLDTAWASGGLKTLTVGAYSVSTSAAVAAPDGSVFTIGTARQDGASPVNRMVVVKLLPTGVPDPAFGSGGVVLLVHGTTDLLGQALALQSDGRLLVAGASGNSFVLMRLTAAGLVDTTLGTAASGYAGLYTDSQSLSVKAVAQQFGGILVLGNVGGIYASDLRLVRFTSAGVPDANYGTGGLLPALPNTNGYSRTPLGLAVLPNGKVWVTAVDNTGGRVKLVLGRYDMLDQLDPSFGVAYSSSFLTSALVAAKPDTTGAALILGTFRYGGNTATTDLFRMNAGGSDDLTFSNGGYSSVTVGHDANQPAGLTQRADGRVFVGGGYSTGFGLLRFRPDGTLDTDFDADGEAFIPMVSGAQAAGLCPLPDGRLIVFGDVPMSSGSSTRVLAWVRFNPGPPEVNVPPVVTQSPTSLSVERGTPVSLTVGVQPGNTLTPWFRWKRNGTVITTENGPALLRSSVEAPDEGAYTVEVGNYAGSTIVGPFTLSVHAPPSILIPPVGYNGPRGITHDLTVTIGGRTPLTYQWRKDSTAVGAPVVTSSLTNTLSVPVSAATEGSYSVIVTNSEGSVTSTPVALVSNPSPPVVVTPPVDLDAVATPDVVVYVNLEVSGLPPFTFQWQKDGKNYGAPVVQDSGVTFLSINGAVASGGSYSCVVTNVDGKVVAGPARTTIWPNPSARQYSPSVLLQVGDSLDLEVSLFTLSDPTKYQWQFNGRNIPGATTSSYLKDNLTFADVGSYRLQLGTVSGTGSSDTATVAMVDPAARAIVAAEGKATSMTVKTAGTGLRYRWRRGDGDPIPAGFLGIDTATLGIAQAHAAVHAGDYICDVTRDGASNTISTGLYTLVIESARPALTDGLALPDGAVGRSYQYALTASHTADKFTAAGLPAGLSCDAATGIISGVPKQAGQFKVTVSAANPVGTSAGLVLPLVIAPLEPGAMGTYAGTLQQGYPGEDPFATFSLSITAAGTYSGKIAYTFNSGHLYTSSFTGQWGDSDSATHGSTSTAVVLPAPDAATGIGRGNIYLTWNADSGLAAYLQYTNANGSQTYWFHMHQNPWNARSARPTPYLGYYTAELAQPPATDSNSDASGSGYVFFTPAASGVLLVACHLPDGATTVAPGFIGADGTAWVFSWLYGYKGMVSGEIVISTGNPPSYGDSGVSGGLHWHRPPDTLVAKGQVSNSYFNGVTVDFQVIGARYLPPNKPLVTGPLMMDADPASHTLAVQIYGGDLTFHTPATNYAFINTHQTTTFPPDALGSPLLFSALSFTPATGLFSGTCREPVFDSSTGQYTGYRSGPFQGIVTRADPARTLGYGAGFFTRAITYTVYNPNIFDPSLILQRFPALVSGAVKILPQ